MRKPQTNINQFVNRKGLLSNSYYESIWDIVSHNKDKFSIIRVEYEHHGKYTYIDRLQVRAYLGKGIFKKFLQSSLIGQYKKEIRAFDIYDNNVSTKLAHILGGWSK